MSCHKAFRFLFFLSLCALADAAPVISSANISGNTITISGSGFGSHADWGGSQAFLNKAWTNFDAGSLNSGGLAIGAYPENWSLQTSANMTNSSYYAERRSVNGELGSLSIDQSGTPTEWYASFWFRMPSNTQGGKFMRVWGSSYNIYLSTGCGDTMIRAYCEGCGGATQWDSAVSFGNNVWKHFEFYMAESPATTQVWIDGVLGWSRPDLTHSGWGANGHTWDIGHMVDDSSRGCGTAGAYQYDGVYLDHTRARVELVNAATWASTAIREPQPPTAWSTTSISAQLNKGAFANGTYYLYVIDSTGAVSNGYAVVLGGGGTNYTVTPSAGSNGSISPSTAQTVASGATTQFSVTPNSGYTASVGGTCGGTLVGTTYTTNPITANCTVTASFAGDTTPPVISSPLPSGVQAYGTTSVTLQVATNEAATCRYNASDVAYASMANTFASTGGTTHQQTGFSTANGTSYTRYVRCSDASGNANTTSTVISFSVSGTAGGPVAKAECASPPAGTIFCADFEEASDAARRAVWDDYDGALDVSFATDAGPSQDGTNHVARFLPTAGNSADLVKVFPTTYDKLYLRFYQYFDAGYDFAWGGHGGGLTAGDRSYLGLSGSRPNGDDRADFTLEQTAAGLPHAYNYYRGMYQDCSNPVGSCFGDSFPCVYDSGASYCTKPHHIKHPSVTWPTATTGTWRCVEEMVDMGGTATANLNGTDPNGRFQIWIDGVALGDYEDLWLRTVSTLKLQNLYMAWRVPVGGNGTVGQRFDNIVVSTQRIGCGTNTTDKTEPTTSNVLPSGTTNSPATLSMTTSESCSAAYSQSRVGHRYKTPFSTTGGTSHSASVAFANGNYTEDYTCMDAAGNISIPALTTFAIGDTQAPTAPSGLTATTVSTTQINLAWSGSTDNVGVVGYSIERCAGASCTTWAEIQSTTGTSTTYNNTGLNPSTTYRYRVRARDATPNYSGYSNIAAATTTITYTVTGSAGTNGSISPSSQTVNSGATATLTVTPNAGYTASASGCGGSLTGTTYTTGSITANCTVTASFADTTPPAVTVTAPTTGSTVSGNIAVSATATDAVGVAGVQFKLDGANLGAEDTAAPYSITWVTTSASAGAHVLTATARDTAGNSATSAGINVTVNNTGPVISNPTCQKSLPRGTTSRTLTATTDMPSHCKFSTVPNASYGTVAGAPTADGTTHAQTVSVSSGRQYQYWLYCESLAGAPAQNAAQYYLSVQGTPRHKIWN